MKINSISTRQFAGLHKTNVNFKDGINVVYGKNESGKSTLVNLMSRTLFQDVKLHKTQDKDFINSFFPTSKKGSDSKADYINGEIEFETSSGKYSLDKKWTVSKGEECYLELPDESSISDNDEINKNLIEALEYGEGVYSNILLSSQRNTDLSLSDILSENGEIKDNLADVLTTAFVQDSDVSIDAIENKINKNIKDLSGKYWDIDTMKPVSNKRMKKDLGGVLTAYYALEDAEEALEEVSSYEEDLKEANDDYKEENKKYIEIKDKFDSFSKVVATLGNSKLIEEKMQNDIELKTKLSSVLENWPVLDRNYKNAQSLNQEKEDLDIISRLKQAKEIKDKLDKQQKKAESLLKPTESEIRKYDDSERNIEKLNSKLSGMNIKAKIKMFGNHKMEIKSLLDGKNVSFKNELDIKGAVDINIDDVMQMSLMPSSVDISKLKNDIEKAKSYIENINKKYKVNNYGELEELADKYEEIETNIDELKEELDDILGGEDFQTIEKSAKAIKKTPRSETIINTNIKKLCGDQAVDRFIIVSYEKLKDYKKDYKNVDSLKQKIKELNERIEKSKNELSKIDSIPKEFRKIEDPQEYLSELKKELDELNESVIEASNRKTEINSNYSNFLDSLEYDPKENLEECKQNYKEQLDLLKHWVHIKKVFDAERAKIDDNPLINLAKNFTSYLSEMTSDRVESEFPIADKLDINIYSNNSELDYSKLSEGTKETVSLAFRLAVLDHLFPNGGGIAVFDDSLTNMDSDRTDKAIKLIKKFAKRHQVIFLTCKNDLIDKLGGNLIEI